MNRNKWKRRIVKLIAVVLVLAVVLFLAVWIVAATVFSGQDHSQYVLPRPVPIGMRPAESSEHAAVAAEVARVFAKPVDVGWKENLIRMREQLDRFGAAAEITSDIHPTVADGVPAEWVIAPSVDPARRLLYIHGGGYVMGSPQSSRLVASRLSEVSKSAVLSIDYRLMPEHSRMAGIEDCRSAYQWMLSNGPDGQETADAVIVAGDSSGGNLALSTIAWVRDSGLRSPDVVVALCPQTDTTLGSPSLRANADTDVMQGASFGPVVNAPKMFSLWAMFLMHKTRAFCI